MTRSATRARISKRRPGGGLLRKTGKGGMLLLRESNGAVETIMPRA
jgi:hypothetical protein